MPQRAHAERTRASRWPAVQQSAKLAVEQPRVRGHDAHEFLHARVAPTGRARRRSSPSPRTAASPRRSPRIPARPRACRSAPGGACIPPRRARKLPPCSSGASCRAGAPRGELRRNASEAQRHQQVQPRGDLQRRHQDQREEYQRRRRRSCLRRASARAMPMSVAESTCPCNSSDMTGETLAMPNRTAAASVSASVRVERARDGAVEHRAAAAAAHDARARRIPARAARDRIPGRRSSRVYT